MLSTLSLVFGGCCSNAITLEQLTSEHPASGSLITFVQFVVVAVYGLFKFLIFTPYPRLRPRRIPLMPYLIQVALFYFVSLLNNAAFAYQIPMTVHIIFRSGGLVISMILGWLVAGKRYNLTQVVSVLLITLGVMLTTVSAAQPSKLSSASYSSSRSYVMGVAILTLALILSGFLGLVQDWTYSTYTQKNTPETGDPTTELFKAKTTPTDIPPVHQESMFYLHFLSLPLFVPLHRTVFTQLNALRFGPKFSLGGFGIPYAYISLMINTLTQLVCVSGVHRLTTSVSALSVTLVLVVRKAVSLVLSVVVLKKGEAGTGMWVGAFLVLLGSIGYAIGTGRKPKADMEKGKGKEE